MFCERCFEAAGCFRGSTCSFKRARRCIQILRTKGAASKRWGTLPDSHWFAIFYHECSSNMVFKVCFSFSGNAIDDSKAIVLRSILRMDTSLKSLDLSCFLSHERESSFIQPFMLCSVWTGNQLTKGVTLILSDILKDNQTIRTLDLSSLLMLTPLWKQ